jgi:dipeptidyl aminopeptidase/acylaminoacyl peptidase
MLPVHDATLSTSGRFVIGFGPGSSLQNLYCYDIKTRVTNNITASLPISQQDGDWDMPLTTHFRGLEVGAWVEDDAAVLIFDSHDIWWVDPTGKKRPRNLSMGRAKNLVFRVVKKLIKEGIRPNDLLLLKAFNTVTKESGFYELDLSRETAPKSLYMGPYLFEGLPDMQNQKFPMKARDVDVFLVTRERADESPNLFTTTDFKKFTLLTAVYPEKKFNWLTSELITFKTLDNTRTQGILYKPEDFDQAKKYPLIINYYEKESDETYHFPKPAEENGALDVAWFVSHGYLVLLEDIHFKIGKPGESVQKAIAGGAKYLSKFPWVDKRHIGIQGHSFGGYETDYLVTHSSLFAAAVTSSGESDLTSEYGTLWPDGASQQEYDETRDGRLGTTPWDNPRVYLKNSPIYYTGDVVAPILIVHNKNDQNVHFEQGLEFFTALRRAGKKVWMLQYDNGGHGLGGQEYKDYVIRMTQFFDHYLKGARPPKWMTQGIPASKKGIDDGLDLDGAVKTPGPVLTIGSVH